MSIMVVVVMVGCLAMAIAIAIAGLVVLFGRGEASFPKVRDVLDGVEVVLHEGTRSLAVAVVKEVVEDELPWDGRVNLVVGGLDIRVHVHGYYFEKEEEEWNERWKRTRGRGGVVESRARWMDKRRRKERGGSMKGMEGKGRNEKGREGKGGMRTI